MVTVMLRNATQDALIGACACIAERGPERARGMIGRSFERIDAMIFPDCRSIHTFFMSQSLDLLFVDAARRVVGMKASVPPWRMVWGPREARTVIELPPGKLCGISLQQNDILSW